MANLGEQYHPRIYAISSASQLFLQELGVWNSIPAERIVPVESMEIHGDRDGMVVLDAWQAAQAELAWIMESGEIEQALFQAVQIFGVPWIDDKMQSYSPGQVVTEKGKTLQAELFIGADGARSNIRKALGVKLIGTVSSPEKAALAKQMGAWETINYSHEDVAKRVFELTDGKKVPVVYDGVGKDTWETSLDCLQPRGLMVSYGNASGAVTGVNLGILASKGSLYVTRPVLATHVDTIEKMQAASKELFDLVLAGKIKIQIDQRVPMQDVAQAHIDLASRKTTGATILTL